MNQHVWDTHDHRDIARAREVFKCFRAAGYFVNTGAGEPMLEFDSRVGSMSFARPPSRYDVLRGDDDGDDDPELGR